ncbi:hypothetical protein Cni_G24485 [Canna indica]|uniref:Coiled-coil SMC6 And NSE5 INteracting (CANIN) domain-containing protein n=1 Tax=Canna indica TaxID=4628 RepID=A0AAQ3QLI3_9LILI|nr:hypothetical protein Cni_G24485 [Canna indica]
MMEEEPLDFEKEDRLLSPTNKRRKVIRLDDLLSDFYEEKNKIAKYKSKHSSSSKGYNSDDDEKTQRKKERMLSKFVDDCQKQVNEMNADDETLLWGRRVFGQQKSLSSIEHKGLPDCQLLQLQSIADVNPVFDLDAKQGESFLEGLLVNKWLSKLAFISGSVDDSIANWIFNKLLYSSNRELQVSACEFWLEMLLSKDEVDKPLVSLGWFPNYSKLMEALDSYGYQSDSSMCCSHTDQLDGPPENFRSWIKVVSACCQIRSHRSIFSSSEAEELLCIIIHLLLDRELQGLSLIINECMQSIIRYFKEEEWGVSCKRVAELIASRIPKDLNSLRVVEFVSVTNNRSKQLRGETALQLLILCFDKEVNNYEGVLEFLLSINVKDKDCDFLKLYIYLVLAENVLLSYDSDNKKFVTLDMWCKYLRKLSSQITNTDWRSYASKVRNKASYLLQSTIERRTS